MLKKTLLFTQKCSLTTKLEQLVIKSEKINRTIPIEDIGFIIIDNRETYVSVPTLTKLIDNNCAVIFCNERHLPHSMLLNLDGHHIQQEVFKQQVGASVPLKKQLWRQTVKEKIKNQGYLLEKITKAKNNFKYLESKVQSGDSTNMEAVAANFYWKNLFVGKFKRDRFGDTPNDLLNYGYTVLRAATARALAGSGLLNTLGIHHRNKYNAFALADDIMEPYRPVVDECVHTIITDCKNPSLTKDIKVILLNVLTRTVYINDEKSTLMVALQRTASSLQQCFYGKRKRIYYPQLWN